MKLLRFLLLVICMIIVVEGWHTISTRSSTRACRPSHHASDASVLGLHQHTIRCYNHAEDQELIPPLNNRKPLKILLCVEPTPFNYVSGYANRFKEMLKFLKKGGDDVRIITADGDPNAPKDFLGFPIISLPGGSMPMYKQVTVSFDFKGAIPKMIKAFKPDVLHVSAPSALIYPATLWGRLFDIPMVMSYHTDLVGYAKTYFPGVPGIDKFARFLVKFFLSRGDLVLCTSPQLCDDMKKIGITRVDVWRKGINTEVFSPTYKDDEMRNYLSDGNPNKPLLLYVGRLGAEKRISRLKKVLDANPNVRLAVVGTGPMGDDLKKEFVNYPVVFTGQLIGESLSKAFASSDVFVMPSDTETLGFVVMEALASGIPVVGVAAGGLIDIIDDKKTGFLVDNSDDMQEFSDKVKELSENQTLRKEMSDAAVAWAMKWNWEAATSKLRNIQYRKAIALHRSRDHTGKFNDDVTNAIMDATSISPLI